MFQIFLRYFVTCPTALSPGKVRLNHHLNWRDIVGVIRGVLFWGKAMRQRWSDIFFDSCPEQCNFLRFSLPFDYFLVFRCRKWSSSCKPVSSTKSDPAHFRAKGCHLSEVSLDRWSIAWSQLYVSQLMCSCFYFSVTVFPLAGGKYTLL